jgi:hypothetical protein
MKRVLVRPVKWAFHKLGYDIVAARGDPAERGPFPPDFEPDEIEDYRAVAPYTLTGPVRVVSLIRAVRYLVHNGVAGDLVECGAWKGGSMMAAAKALLWLGQADRRLWLYDTFAGMSEPTAADTSVCNYSAWGNFRADWLRVPREAVRRAMLGTGYPPEGVVYVEGKVEDTIPGQAPGRIALLRLDTDWYESTRHELTHLFPRLVRGGVLLIDDYGH